MSDDNRATIILDGEVSPLKKSMMEAKAALEGFGKSGTGSINQLAGSLGVLQESFVRVGGLLMGGAVGAGLIQLVISAADAQDKLNDLAKTAGVSVEDLSGLSHAAKLSGADLDSVAKSINKLSSEMGKDPGKFRQLGITAREPIEAFKQLADILKSVEDVQTRNAIAERALGESYQQVIPLLLEGGRAIGEMTDKGRELSGVTRESAEEADKLNDNLQELKASADGLAVTIANPLITRLNELIAKFRDAREAAGSFWSGLKVWGTTTGDDEANPTAAYLRNVEKLKTLREQRVALASDSVGAKLNRFFSPEDLAIVDKQIATIEAQQKYLENIMQRRAAVGNEYRDSWMPAASRSIAPTRKSISTFLGNDNKPKKETDKSEMSYYEALLAKKKEAFSQENALRDYSKAQELAYWESILNFATLSANDRLAVERKVSTLAVEVRKQEAQQVQALDAESTRSAEALALARVDAEQAAMDGLLAAEQITQTQALAQEQGFELKRYAIKRQALQDKLALYDADPELNPVEMARIKNQLLELEQQYQVKKNQLTGKYLQVQKVEAKKATQVWSSLGQSFSSLWDKGVQAMMNGTLRWRNALKAIGTELVGWFGKNVVGALLKNWIAGKAAEFAVSQGWLSKEKAISLGFMQEEVSAKAVTASKSIGITGAQAMTEVGNKGASAAAGAADSVASIPYLGPILAAAAFAATLGMVLGARSNIKSASKGFTIPKGLNPITQLHEEEMVLPSELANPMREMLMNGGGATQPTINLNFNAAYHDRAGIKKLLLDNYDGVSASLKRAVRNANLTRNSRY